MTLHSTSSNANSQFPHFFYQDSGDLRTPSSTEVLHRITEVVNETLANDSSCHSCTLSTDDILAAIDSGKSEGGPVGRHWVLDPIDGTKG